MAKRKHITDIERMEIEHELQQRSSLKKIAEKIGKHHSSISREILARRTPSSKGAFGRITNRCISRGVCNRRQLCMDKPDCTRRCSTCRACNQICPDFTEEVCSKLAAPPYVCNGCADETACVLRKFYYLHKLAHRNYREMLTESREGANITEEELISLDELVSPLIRQGQSLHHILVNNPDCFTMNDKTLYRYVAGGLLHAKNGDMPRVCQLKPRAGKPVEHKVDTGCRIGRTYVDYLAYMATAPDLRAVEIDSVIGRVGGKVLLTLMFPWCGLMLAFLRDRNDSQSVIDAFARLWNLSGPDLYRRLFAVLLGDNGSEFSNPKALELDPDGNFRTRVFYCDPRATNQKARIERNHEFIRMILPKGTSFDRLVQTDIDLMMSHINSYSRPSLGDKTPFDLFSYVYGTDLLEALGLRRIAPNDILLKPRLIP
jgi:IS30 family transposase